MGDLVIRWVAVCFRCLVRCCGLVVTCCMFGCVSVVACGLVCLVGLVVGYVLTFDGVVGS